MFFLKKEKEGGRKVAATEIRNDIWLTKPKTFAIWSFIKKSLPIVDLSI